MKKVILKKKTAINIFRNFGFYERNIDMEEVAIIWLKLTD